MKEAGNIAIVMNKVHDGPEYEAKYREIFDLCEEWKAKWLIEVQYIYTAHDRTRRYYGHGESLAPVGAGDFRLSYKTCEAKESRTLFEGRLYKCSRLAYLALISRYFKLSDEWRNSLSYKPLEPNCSEEALINWLNERAGVECSECPTERENLTELPSPLRKGKGEFKI